MGAAPVTFIPSGAPVEMFDLPALGMAPNGYASAGISGVTYYWPVWSP